jgi:hypothetical protein
VSGQRADSSAGPLAGVTVVALEQAVAVPFATRQLVDLGARVIKIERPGGDFARQFDRTGTGGPYATKKAYDLLVQCEAGLLSVTGTKRRSGWTPSASPTHGCGRPRTSPTTRSWPPGTGGGPCRLRAVRCGCRCHRSWSPAVRRRSAGCRRSARTRTRSGDRPAGAGRARRRAVPGGDDHPAHPAGRLTVPAVETTVLSVALVAVAIRLTPQRS